MTRTIYLLDENGVFTGEQVCPDGDYPAHGKFVFDAPPPHQSPEVAVVAHDGWHILPAYPMPEPYLPKSCSPAQGLVALFVLKQITEADILAAIDAIADDVGRYIAKVAYDKATFWNRTSASTALLASILNLSEQDLDQLFAYAATVDV